MQRVLSSLLSYRGSIGRVEFMMLETARFIALGLCYGLYRLDLIVLTALLLPAAIWPGVVGTIKRFRDLGHDPIWILPVLMYLSAGFALGYVLKMHVVGLVTLGIYLTYVLGFKGRTQQDNMGDEHVQ